MVIDASPLAIAAVAYVALLMIPASPRLAGIAVAGFTVTFALTMFVA
jgi:hypothetical protein